MSPQSLRPGTLLLRAQNYYSGLNTYQYYFGVPDYNFRMIYPQNPILSIKAPILWVLRAVGLGRPQLFTGPERQTNVDLSSTTATG